MIFRLALWALALLSCAVRAEQASLRQAPSYAASTIINLATGRPGPFAPNTLVALYGRELSVATAARDATASMPSYLGSPPVNVKINGILAPMEYVSPEVVVFLIPADQMPGPASIRLTRSNINGPLVKISVDEFAPGLFELEYNQVFARHMSDLAPVSAQSPAAPGETIILYATGLGEAVWPLSLGQPPATFLPILNRALMRVLLNGEPLDPRHVIDAGLPAGRLGCYEVTLKLPSNTPDDPEIRLAMGDAVSQSGLRLNVRWPTGETTPQPQAPPERSNR